MTNRDILNEAATLGIPDAAEVMAKSRKPRRRVGRVAAIACAAILVLGAGVATAQGYMSELEQFEDAEGKALIEDIALLETGKWYTIEHHSKYSDPHGTPDYHYNIYKELPEGIELSDVPSLETSGNYSDEDENRTCCMGCHGYVWTVDDPVEHTFQRPSASEPETFHIRTLSCVRCGYELNRFDVDGKPIPMGLEHELAKAYREKRGPVTPDVEGVEFIEDMSQLQPDVVYRMVMIRDEVFIYESTPENISKVGGRGFICSYCLDSDWTSSQHDVLAGEPEIKTFTDDYGDEYTYEMYSMFCAECGEVVTTLVDD